MDRSLLFPLLTPAGRRHRQDVSGMNRHPSLPAPAEATPIYGRHTGRRRQMPFFIRWWLALQG